MNRAFSFCAKVLGSFRDEPEALVEYAIKFDDNRLVTSIFSLNVKPDEVTIPDWFKKGAEIIVTIRRSEE